MQYYRMEFCINGADWRRRWLVEHDEVAVGLKLQPPGSVV
jgi:hypothetical protein